jgi:hypothetical protein
MGTNMYRLWDNAGLGRSIIRLSDNAYLPFDPANRDYRQFVSQINADEAQLEDVDGNLMTAEEAKAYVATLPKQEPTVADEDNSTDPEAEAPVDAPA